MTIPTQSITFTEAVQVLDHEGEITEAYEAGQTVSLRVDSARRWLRRGLAVDAPSKPRKTTRKKAKTSEKQQPGGEDQPDRVDPGPDVEE